MTCRCWTGLEPVAFWGRFEELTTIARPSRHEEPVIEHVRDWAAERGFELQQDAGRNLVIRVPATPGPRGCADPRCSRATWTWCASAIPPARTIRPRGGSCSLRDGDWLTADGTTLGADDGVAIAAMMTLVEDESIPHGPLELLMTVAEEVGLEGANALDGSLLTGTTLINLDSEEDGVLTVGCAGQHRHLDPGRRAARRRARRTRSTLSVAAGGGLGGHSGVQIALGHANAIKVLGRVLREAHAAAPVPARLARRRQEPQRDPARRRRGLLGAGASRRRRSGRRSSRRPRPSETPTRRPTRARP